MKKISVLLILLTLLSVLSIPVSARAAEQGDGPFDVPPDYLEPPLFYKDGTYDVYSDYEYYVNYCTRWNFYNWRSKDKDEITLEYNCGMFSCDDKIKVPNSLTAPLKNENKKKQTKYTSAIRGSCAIKEFDLDPENKYMKLVDNVVFSKDGKILMSYARSDERKKYKIPDGTKVIGEAAFRYCTNFEQLTIPASVTEIQSEAFFHADSLKKVYIPKNSKLKEIDKVAFTCTKLEELTLPNFDFKISDRAFGSNDVKLKSYVKPDVSFKKTRNGAFLLKWDEVPNASYYEVYQKKSNGKYKLLKTIDGNSIKINGLNSGKTYTFAVKPTAVIKAVEAVGYSNNGGNDQYIIEGSMSEDVTINMME